MSNFIRHVRWSIAALVLFCGLWPRATPAAEQNASYHTALESITAAELGQTVQYLAGPELEGREAGSPGGQAAADYLVAQLTRFHLQPAGLNSGFFQPFPPNYRNILALVPGSDRELKNDVILVGAHYDHLGHGLSRGRSNPGGPIYPGADDNASGSSGVLQLAQAFTLLAEPPKRSILLVFWDAEEKGLLGSKYWTGHPTVPLDRVAAALNADMIGRLRENRLLIYGSRTGYGWQRLLAEQNRESGLELKFSWLLQANADHFSFYAKGIPVVMFHTGLHEAYHRPNDDASHINSAGMAQVTRLLFATAYELANRPAVPRFRAAAGQENDEARRRMEAPDLSPVRPGDPPLRLGISWRLDDADPCTIVLSQVVAGSPAAVAGLNAGDRIYQIGGRDFADEAAFAKLAKTLPGPIELLVERNGQIRVVVVHLGPVKQQVRQI